jgi:hypothetical protein
VSFRLFVDSATGVTVEPTWDTEEQTGKLANVKRTREGSRYGYQFGERYRVRCVVTFVGDDVREQINLWWSNNTRLKWMEEGGSEVYDVKLVNSRIPIDKRVRALWDRYEGELILEGNNYEAKASCDPCALPGLAIPGCAIPGTESC